MNDNRNMVVALLLSLVVVLAWQYLVGYPAADMKRDREVAKELLARPGGDIAAPRPAASGNVIPDREDRESILAATPRVAINTPSLGGSINLVGAQIDDITLKKYRESVDPDSKAVLLLSPRGTWRPYNARFGWVNASGFDQKLPDSKTAWRVEKGQRLTPSTPVTLSYDNQEGLLFKRTFSIDQHYVITISDEVLNKRKERVSLHPYSAINHHGTPETEDTFLLHEGIIGVLGEKEGTLRASYTDMQKRLLTEVDGQKGWLGITSKYWATALIPSQDIDYRARISAFPDGKGDFTYQTSFLHMAQIVAPGEAARNTTRLFVGAKEVSVVDGYEKAIGVYKFDQIIDWGLFYFITKPLFYVLDFFYNWTGNFGLSILIVTVLVKGIFFPLAQKSYVAMGKMKLLQPELLNLREKYKDDPAKQQQEMIKFYKEQKVNPAAGCLPVLAQIPVFFALYKVLFITIEMRHAPFFGWIKDLAAPDPTSLLNLFGLLPFDPSVIPLFGSLFHIGIWPLFMGVTMFLQMQLSPKPPDAVQAAVFTWMPVLFTFMLSSFPAGLVIYWTWNNLLSILQQATIMKHQGAKIELWDNLVGLFRRNGPSVDSEKEKIG